MRGKLEKGKQAWEKQWKLLQGPREELKAILTVILGEKGDRCVCRTGKKQESMKA